MANELAKIIEGSQSKAFKALNAHLLRHAPPAGIRAEKPECHQRSEGQDRGVEAPKERTRYIVSFIVRRPRLLDEGDNDRSALKPGRDFVTAMVGLASDNCPEIEFHYHQIKSRSRSTTILIETMTFPANQPLERSVVRSQAGSGE